MDLSRNILILRYIELDRQTNEQTNMPSRTYATAQTEREKEKGRREERKKEMRERGREERSGMHKYGI